MYFIMFKYRRQDMLLEKGFVFQIKTVIFPTCTAVEKKCIFYLNKKIFSFDCCGDFFPI